METITLKSGLRVGNFSSPHPFVFTTGEVLPGCSPETARELMLEAIETETHREGWVDIGLVFKLSDSVRKALISAEAENVDVVIVPLPVLTAMKAEGMRIGKMRTCRVADRVAKTIWPDKFCI
jgi:hypothetical protein